MRDTQAEYEHDLLHVNISVVQEAIDYAQSAAKDRDYSGKTH